MSETKRLKQVRKRQEYERKRNVAKSTRKKDVYSREHFRWQFYFRDEKYVAKRFQQGKADFVTGTGWGFFDRFYTFLWSIGFFSILNVAGKGYSRQMLAITKLLLTYSIKILLGISSLNKVPALLFREIALMKLIGFTAQELQYGICKRGKGKSQPMHKDTLGDLLARLTRREVEYILNSAVKILSQKGFLKSSTFILDATDLILSRKIRGAGTKKYIETKYDRKTKKMVEIEVIKHGFKLIVLQEVRSRIIVAAKFVKLNQHENEYTLSLIQQARENIPDGKIKLLLIDRGFIDGETLWKIKKEYNIDFIVRVRYNMEIAKDARAFRHLLPDDKSLFYEERVEKDKKVEVMGISSLTTYDQYGDEEHVAKRYRKDFVGNPINAVVVLCWDGKEYEEGHEPVFITSLKINSPLEIIDKYGLRSLIENCCFRELKQGWHLGKFPKKTIKGIRAHTLLTVTMYSLNAGFLTEEGKKITEKGIRRLRDEDMHTIHKIVVFADDYFGIFDLEELCIIMRAPPQICLRVNPQEVKRRFDLEDE